MINSTNNDNSNSFINYKYFDCLINILNFGLKFIPCFFNNKSSLFLTFLNFFENELCRFNKQLFFLNRKLISNNSTSNTTSYLNNNVIEDKSNFEYLFKLSY
jgi:hypothetical protein